MVLKSIIALGIENPKRIFQIDRFGAILSAFLLGIVLVKLENPFGIPKPTLYVLASFPCFFAIYDFYCYFIIDKNLGFPPWRAFVTRALAYQRGSASSQTALYSVPNLT